MNNTQKLLLAVGVGIGVGYLYKKFYYKGKSTTKTNSPSTTTTTEKESFQLPQESVVSDLTREEKEEFILENVSATPQEVSSGFEGVRFVWNPNLNKMYPVGTIVEGEEPTFGEVFNSAEGKKRSAQGQRRMASPILQSVENAEKSLNDLSEQEIELLFRITKKMKENPSITSEEEAVTEMGITNPNVIKAIRQKLKKRLNDIKIMKGDVNWKEKWAERKEKRKKRRKDFKDKLGVNKDSFDKLALKKCGRKPLFKSKMASYKKCVESLANGISSKIKNEVRQEISSAPVSVKNEINNERQKSFAKEITNRSSGGIYGGERWDGESNAYVENLVDKGLV
jgi:hypothetical protein